MSSFVEVGTAKAPARGSHPTVISGRETYAGKLPAKGSPRLFGAVLFLRGGFHDHTADLFGVGFVHDEPPAAALKNFSLFWNMPGFKAQVAADGIHLVSFQLDAEFFQILKVGAAGQRITRIPKRMDILFLGRIVLILNVAHDLLKDVLDGGKAGRSAIFVHGDGDMVLAGPEFLKQLAHDLGFGYKKRANA